MYEYMTPKIMRVDNSVTKNPQVKQSDLERKWIELLWELLYINSNGCGLYYIAKNAHAVQNHKMVPDYKSNLLPELESSLISIEIYSNIKQILVLIKFFA